MGWDGNGVYTRTNGDHTGSTVWSQDKNDSIKITSARHDTHDQDLANGINNCLAKDGQNAMTGNLDLGGQDIINVGSGNVTIIPPVTDTFLPTVYGSTTPGTFSYSQQDGSFVTISNEVYYNIHIVGFWSADFAGDLRISLPHTIATGLTSISRDVQHVNFAAESSLTAIGTSTQGYLTLAKDGTNGNRTTITISDRVSSINELIIQGRYTKS